MPPSNSPSRRLKDLRDYLDHSQRDLATLFDVAPAAIAQWETGERPLSGPALKLLELYEAELGLNGANESEVRFDKKSRLLKPTNLAVTAWDLATIGLVNTFKLTISSDRSITKLREQMFVSFAERLAERLTEMRGFGAKIFQTMNSFSFVLPPELSQVFESFSTLPEPMPSKAVARIFMKELGKSPTQIFSSWEGQPFASASVGQVHRARLQDDQVVAVKVQYPKIVNAIESDLEKISAIRKLTSFLLPGQNMGELLEELALRFKDECNYSKEADYQERFRTIYLNDPSLLIPRVNREFSTQRILVTDYIRATSFKEFAKNASQDARDLAGISIWKFAFHSILQHGIFNADPQPENFRFQNQKVVCLDFGCVTTFSPEFLKKFRFWLQTLIQNDPDMHRKALIDFGIAKDGANYDFDHHFETAKLVYRPMLADEPTSFSSQEMQASWREYFVNSPNRRIFNHSKEWVFLMRLNWGLSFTLASLGSRANWRRLLIDQLNQFA